MIFAKTTPYGIDKKLKAVQTSLNSQLSKLWLGTIEVYGKIEPTKRNDKIIPEVYVSGTEYREIFVNDRVTATIGFIVKDRAVANNLVTAKIDIVFTVDLKKAYGVSLREDEKAIIQAKKAVEKSMLCGAITKINTGIDDVFKGFDRERVKHRDMQPWLVFSLETEITYDETINC